MNSRKRLKRLSAQAWWRCSLNRVMRAAARDGMHVIIRSMMFAEDDVLPVAVAIGQIANTMPPISGKTYMADRALDLSIQPRCSTK